MLERYKTGFIIAAVYIGALMGAGFATGQELIKYFLRFGAAGFAGIVLCGAAFALVGFKVLWFVHINGIEGYSEFLRRIMGRRLGLAAEAVSFCFIIALYSSMTAAAGSLMHQLTGIGSIWGSALLVLICSVMTIAGVRWLGIVNLILCPLLAGGSVLIGLWLYFGSVSVFAPIKMPDDNLLGSAVVYISYNVISCVSLLCALSGRIKNIRDAVTGGIIGGLAVGAAGLALALPLYKYLDIAVSNELPLYALMQGSGALKLIYCTLLCAAVLTTAAGNCCSIVEGLKPKNTGERVLWTILSGIAALMLSRLGFENIVGRMYYVFGCMGAAELAFIVCLKLREH